MAFFYFQVASKIFSETCRTDLKVQFLTTVMKKYKKKMTK